MAVERMERGARGRRLAWVLAALVALGLLLALLFRGGAAIGDERGATVRYDGARWVEAGAPVPYPLREMAHVGETPAGHALYTHRVQAIAAGGGGGMAESREPLVTRLYLRTETGEFLPLEREE